MTFFFFFLVFFFKGIRVLVPFFLLLEGWVFVFFFWQYVAFFSQIHFHPTCRKWRHSREPYTSLLLAPLEEQAPPLNRPAATGNSTGFCANGSAVPLQQQRVGEPSSQDHPRDFGGTLPFKGFLHSLPPGGSTHKGVQAQASLCMASRPAPGLSLPFWGVP